MCQTLIRSVIIPMRTMEPAHPLHAHACLCLLLHTTAAENCAKLEGIVKLPFLATQTPSNQTKIWVLRDSCARFAASTTP